MGKIFFKKDKKSPFFKTEIKITKIYSDVVLQTEAKIDGFWKNLNTASKKYSEKYSVRYIIYVF